MDAKELSSYANFSLQTIYNLVHTNQIPYHRVSKKRAVFYKDEIDEWLKTRKRKIRRAKPIPVREPGPDHDAKADSGAEEATLPNLPSMLIPPRPLPPPLYLPPSEPHRSVLRSAFIRRTAVLLFIAAGWGGAFLYFHDRAASDSPSDAKRASADSIPAAEPKGSSHGVMDLTTLMEQERPGKIDVRIPSTESELAEVHLKRVSDIELQSEGASLIKPLLVQALKDGSGDYASRSKTIDFIRPYADDPKIQEAIIHLARNEKDPAIRLKAVTVLDKFADSDAVKDVLLDRLLNDTSKGIRFKALEIIEKNMDRRSIQVIEKMKDREPDESIRNKAQAIFDKYQRTII